MGAWQAPGLKTGFFTALWKTAKISPIQQSPGQLRSCLRRISGLPSYRHRTFFPLTNALPRS
jgi:hypothetical protein